MILNKNDTEILSFKEKLLKPQPPTVYFTNFQINEEYHFRLINWLYPKQVTVSKSTKSSKVWVYDVFCAIAQEDYLSIRIMKDEECNIHIAESSFVRALDWYYRENNKRLQTAIDFNKISDIDVKFVRKSLKMFEITHTFLIYKEQGKYPDFDYVVK